MNSIRTAFLFVALNSMSSVIEAQPNCQWTKGYGGNTEDFGTAVTVDPFGNVYSVGQFNSPTIVFGSNTLTNADVSGTYSDAFVMKSDSCGNILWVKKLGEQFYDDRAKAVVTDKSGNVYVTGAYNSYYIKFGTDSLANTGEGFSTYLVKYTPSGSVIWSRDLEQEGSVFPSGLSIDKSGNVCMSGYYSDTIKFDAIELYADYYYNTSFLAKFNPTNGSVVWAKNLEYNSNRALCIATDTLDNIYIAGSFDDSVKVESTVFYANDDYYTDAYFIKYNSSGNIVWVKTAGANYDDGATGLATDKAGNVFLSGYYQSDSLVFGSVKLFLPNPSVWGNGFLIKFNDSGTALWGKRTGGLSEDYTDAVTTNAAGDVFVAGNFRSQNLSLDGITLTNSSSSTTTFDLYVAKYNSNGQIKWARSAGGSANDFVENITIGLNGFPFITGEFESSSISFGNNTLTNSGSADVFITNDINRIGMPVPQLCEVTVDELSQNNMIYWDKTSYTNVSYFVIYRETSANTYNPIANIHADSLSLFVDTVRTKYFPNTGNPNAGTYRYKIQIQDTTGNYSLLSPFHNTLYIVDNGSGQFTWNPSYTIEGSANPVNNYILKRDNNGSGTWTTVASVTGNQNTIADPAYSNYPQGKWRVETDWALICDPTRAGVNTTRSNIKSSAVAISVNELANKVINVYPNPATDEITIESPVGSNSSLKIFDALGQLVFEEALNNDQASKGMLTKQLNVNSFRKGIYIINVQTESGSIIKRLTIQ